MMNAEFETHLLNDEGIAKAKSIALHFDTLLEALKKECLDRRYLSIVKTKLEETCFFAKKAMACNPCNQKDTTAPDLADHRAQTL